jgi:hypothetical protein
MPSRDLKDAPPPQRRRPSLSTSRADGDKMMAANPSKMPVCDIRISADRRRFESGLHRLSVSIVEDKFRVYLQKQICPIIP